MSDPRFQATNQPPKLNAFEVGADDPEFLRPSEFTFIFFNAAQPRVRLLFDKRENYQQGTIQFSEYSLSASDYLNRPCVHCKKPVSTVSDCCIAIHKQSPVCLVHESCFKQWFSTSDTGAITPFRLARTKRARLGIQGSSFKLSINDAAGVEEHTFMSLEEVPLKDLGKPAQHEAGGGSGTIVQAGGFGFSGTPPQGMNEDDYVAHMHTLVGPGESAGRPAPRAGAAPWPPSPAAATPGRAAPSEAAAGPSDAVVTCEVECPCCRTVLRLTLGAKRA